MVRVLITSWESSAQFAVDCHVFQIKKGYAYFYHYSDYFLAHPTRPFRVMPMEHYIFHVRSL